MGLRKLEVLEYSSWKELVGPGLLLFASWLPWCKQLPQYTLQSTKPADHGQSSLKLWAKINTSTSGLSVLERCLKPLFNPQHTCKSLAWFHLISILGLVGRDSRVPGACWLPRLEELMSSKFTEKLYLKEWCGEQSRKIPHTDLRALHKYFHICLAPICIYT